MQHAVRARVRVSFRFEIGIRVCSMLLQSTDKKLAIISNVQLINHSMFAFILRFSFTLYLSLSISLALCFLCKWPSQFKWIMLHVAVHWHRTAPHKGIYLLEYPFCDAMWCVGVIVVEIQSAYLLIRIKSFLPRFPFVWFRMLFFLCVLLCLLLVSLHDFLHFLFIRICVFSKSVYVL